jgi:SAM-dependent methyltransferase
MLQTLTANAGRLGLEVTTRAADAEQLPFADESFDLVFGHAVLHHIPDLPRAFGEFSRVLRPGGTLLFAGEPSRYGDLMAAIPKRSAGRSRPSGAGRSAPRPRRTRRRARTRRSSVSSTCTRSHPASCAGWHAGRAFATRG